MEDKIRLDFLSRINQVAEEMVQERFNLMETEFEESLPAIMKDFSSQMGSVMEQYQRQQEEIHHQLQIEFRSQTRVKECELDAVIYYLAERFKKEAEKLIPELLSKFLGEYGADMFGDETVDFMLGELFDKSELAAQWKPQKEKSDEGETDG